MAGSSSAASPSLPIFTALGLASGSGLATVRDRSRFTARIWALGPRSPLSSGTSSASASATRERNRPSSSSISSSPATRTVTERGSTSITHNYSTNLPARDQEPFSSDARDCCPAVVSRGLGSSSWMTLLKQSHASGQLTGIGRRKGRE